MLTMWGGAEMLSFDMQNSKEVCTSTIQALEKLPGGLTIRLLFATLLRGKEHNDDIDAATETGIGFPG